MRRPSPFDWIAAVLLAAAAAWVAAMNRHYSYDDAFITFRMAAQAAEGHGFVYNAGEWHLGSTAALYGLMLAGFGRLAGPAQIPAIAGWCSAAALLATGTCLYLLFRGPAGGADASDRAAAPDPRAVGLAAGLLYVTSPMVFVTFGGEMPVLLAVVAAACLALDRGRTGLAAGLGAVAALVRPDGVLALGVVLGTIALRRRRFPWREASIAAALLLPFVLLAWHAYGTPLPATLDAKLAQRDSGLWARFAGGLRDWVVLFLWNDRGPNLGFAPVVPPTLWLWTAIGAAAVWRYRRAWSLLAYAALFVGAYAALRVPFYHWYAAPAALALAAFGGAGLAQAATWLTRLAPGAGADGERLRRTAAVVAVAAVLAIAWRPLRALPRTSALNDTARLYIEAGRWLAGSTPPGSRVGYYEIGYIGFHGGRPMVDALGLIDPSIAPAVAAHDWARAFRRSRPDYILEKPGVGLNTFLAEPWFAAEYRLEREMQVGRERLRIHRRLPDANR
jgi:hypothetical protein